MTTDGNLSTSDLAATPQDGATGATAATPEDEQQRGDTTGVSTESSQPASTPLFSNDDATRFHERWQDIQTGFVDEPRQAVEQADALVAELMKRLAGVFAEERSNLEAQWGQGQDVGTEELRVALQRYRSFFQRLLST